MRKNLIDPAEIGAKGGKARAMSLSAEELSASASKAIQARWDAYYAAHPEKLEAKLKRQKKANGKK